MRNLFLGLALAIGIRSAWSDCTDTTILLKAGTTGFIAGTGAAASASYDPTSLNGLIKGCTGGTMTVRLNLDATEAGKTKDTVKLTGPIVINGRTTGKTTALSMLRPASFGTAVDTIFTFVEGGTDPRLLIDSAGNQALISNMAFARKVINSAEHTVNILAKGSQVSACHFWMADKDSSATGALVNVGADSVLVERSLFRAPIDGIGRTYAIRASGNPMAKLEIRANVFQSTGVFIGMSGPFHLIANTFVGSRNRFNPVIIGNTIGTNFNNAVIMHNLFAAKADTLPPIVIGVTGAITADSILRNAWGQGKTNLALAVNDPAGAAATLRGATGANANIALPRGFSNYGPNAGDVKDYPLTQLRSDPTLARKHPDFGKVYRVFLTGSWSGTPAPISDISTMLGTKMYFTGFTSFLPSKPWVPNVKVGAFVDWDDVEVPSPLAAGGQGSSFKLQKDSSGNDKAKITLMKFDQDYYKQIVPPAVTYFFFSNTLSKLTASNDTTALKAASNPKVNKDWLNFDSILMVPREVRNAGADIYVKMLQFRGSYMAPVLSTAAIGTLSNFPGFPVNDLTLNVIGSDSPNRTVNLKVTRGTEQIDSVRIEAMIEGGKVVESKSFPATPASGLANLSFTVSAKGIYTFQAVPVASIGGGVFKAGAATSPTAPPIPLGITASDSLYVTYKTGGCPGATGESANPYCLLDSALKAASTRNGGTTIIVRNASPAVNLETLTIDPVGPTDTASLTITSGLFNENRPIIRGTASKEALVINRKNVTLRGFTIEQPPAGTKTALVLKAGGCLIDANIFRASSKGAVEAPAIGVEVGATAEARIVNNVVWGFAKNVQLTSTISPNVKILYNTFVADSALNKGATVGIAATGTDSVRVVIADNFFSGQTSAVDKDLVGNPVLDHNVRTSGASLNGKLESGGLGFSTPIPPGTDIWIAKYPTAISDAMLSVVVCNSLSPCNPLYAGSSTNEYDVTVTTDAFGNLRKNQKDVGAYEYPSSPSGVLGVLEIKPSLVPGNFRKVSYTVTGISFDTNATETDSVQVFWAKSDVSQNLHPNLDNIPAAQRTAYPISKLAKGPITDVADGIESESTKYWFFAALSRNPAPHTTRVLGYPYSDTIITSRNLLFGDCDFRDSKLACPSEVGAFGVDSGVWRNLETRVTLTQATDTGHVLQPRFISVADVNQYNLDLTSPLPILSFDAHVKGLGVAGSQQKLTWQVEFYFNPDLSGLNLFLLPKDPKGLPTLVPDWKIVPLSGGKYQLNFESTVDGAQSYAFGKLQAGLAPGMVLPADPVPPLYDFNLAHARGDSAEYPISIKMKGSGFKTANPLVLISTIPAGGTINPPAGSKAPRVISGGFDRGGYPSRTVVASAGYADLPEDLRKTRIHQLYLKAAAAETVSPAPVGQNKPFILDSVSFGKFDSSTQILDTEMDLAGGEMAVKVPVGRYFNDYLSFADKIGKTTRSLEVVFTVFDGSRISRTRGFIRTKFYKKDIQSTELYNRQKKGFEQSTHDKPRWNLFGYPWDEADTAVSLARIVEKDKWDKDHMRLWSYKGTGEGANAFNQYDGTNPAAIKFDSGMAAWSGSTNDYTPQCASGTSLDYQPFKLGLEAGRFYDFALPFSFPMKWQDILDSSGLTAANGPAIWHYNDSTLPAKWDKVQVASASPPTQESVLIPWEGYTLKAASPLTLTFPVMDSSRSASVVAKTAAGDGSWAVEVEASDASAAMELRIGRGSREMLFPEPPDVPGQDFRISLLKGDQKISEYIQTLEGGWQGHWSLRGNAAKGSDGLSLRIGEATRQVPIWLADAMHGTAVPLSADQPVRVSEEDLRANDYHLIAGDKDYVEGVLRSLTPGHLLALSNYPNPFTASTLLRYALPAGFARTTFDLKIRDFRGRMVWQKTIVAGNALSYLWDGRDLSGAPLPAGVYTLSLTAKAENKSVYRAVRNLLRM